MMPLAAATRIGGKVTTGDGATMHAAPIDGGMANSETGHTKTGMTQGHRSTRADQSSMMTITGRGVARERQTEISLTKGEELTDGMAVLHAFASCHLTYVHIVRYIVARSCLPV